MSEASVPNPFVGQLLDGRYRIVREVAVGGMSAVYEGIHVKIGRTVAIKVLHREMAGDPDAVARFLNEARAVGTFGHPNIVASTDFGELPGNVPYLVLEYLHGHTLAHEIAANGPLTVRRTVEIALQIASALDAAHARGVVHRDLKSDNVFLIDHEGNPDHVKVLDFGISKFLAATDLSPRTRRGLTMGTPEFMSPEQISDPQAVDARSDIYALGVVMYHALTGQPPFGFLPLQNLLTQIVVEPPPAIERQDVPAGVLAVVMKALAKSPSDRFANMREMGMALERFSSQSFGAESPAGVSGVVAAPMARSGSRSATYSGRVMTPGVGVAARAFSQPVSAPRARVPPPLGAPVAEPSSTATPFPPPAVEPPRRSFVFFVAGVLVAAVLVLGWLLWQQSQIRPAPVLTAAPVPPGQIAEQPAAPSPVATPIQLRIGSLTPHARVTLRGRTHLLPFAEAVKPGTQPEIVELTAPGHEGKRFWITFDRPTQLQAQLPVGRGMAEETAEETLIALGEPPVDGASGGGVPSPAHAPPTRHSLTARPRSVGASGVKLPWSSPTQAPGPSATSVLATANPPAHTAVPIQTQPQPAASAAPVPSKVEMARLDPSAAGSVSPSPSPSPSPSSSSPSPALAKGLGGAPLVAASVAPGAAPGSTPGGVSRDASPGAASASRPTTKTGSIEPVQTQAVVKSHLPEVQSCYERGKMDDPELHGRVTVRITIGPTGTVAASTLDSSSIGDSGVESCIVNAVHGWRFPAPAGGSAVISYPFNLR